jgi:hypothetical protein
MTVLIDDTLRRPNKQGGEVYTMKFSTVFILHVMLLRATKSSSIGRAMAQDVSRRPLTAEARVRARINPCGICGGQNGTGTGFSQSSSVLPSQYIISPSLSKLISSGE